MLVNKRPAMVSSWFMVMPHQQPQVGLTLLTFIHLNNGFWHALDWCMAKCSHDSQLGS